MNMDDLLHTFVVESRELLGAMETALLYIEYSPATSKQIDAIFRAAHTIKGSAGLFDLTDIVELTHLAESVLDRIRSGELALILDVPHLVQHAIQNNHQSHARTISALL